MCTYTIPMLCNDTQFYKALNSSLAFKTESIMQMSNDRAV